MLSKIFTELTPPLQESLQKLIASDVRLSLYVSGGCSSILGWLTLLGGSSKVIAETRNLYCKGSACSLLGYDPDKFVDSNVTRDLALSAFTNTQKYMYYESNNLSFDQNRVLGVGISGALRSNFERKGLHHAYISLVDQKKYTTYYIILDKNKRSREEEDYFIGYNVLNLINTPITETPTLVGELLPGDEIKVLESKDTIDLLLSTLETTTLNIIFLPGGKMLANQILKKCAVIPGSFNPLHDGHVALAEAVAKKFELKDSDIIFELSALNADKGLISREEIEKRVKVINERGFGAMLTNRPFFYAKNEYLKNGYFVVGTDTYKRIIDTKYYSNSNEVMISKLAEFLRCENHLVVAPRLNSQTNKLETLADFSVPEIFKNIHELDNFRMDISSTELRQKVLENEQKKE